ncbi:glycosyltransferase [Timonella sp. A28]|uniref:glycosyltransferase family 2 protein n=1 Tax=Timonella sp. A28 TaxID=3442640 RepID=UPI003EBA7061
MLHDDDNTNPIVSAETPRSHDTTPSTHTLNTHVLAVIVTQGNTPYLPGLLASIAQQTHKPGRVLIIDVLAENDINISPLHNTGINVEVIQTPRAKTFGQAVSNALAMTQPTQQWLWLLHDDTVADPRALELLLKPTEFSSTVSVIGAKHIKLGSDNELISVGYTAATGGRRFTGVENHEFDQGQHDGREDVLAVPLNGALVTQNLWTELKGTESTYGKYGDSIDFCRRARLAGHRVIVVPTARIEHAQASLMRIRQHKELVETPSPSVLDDSLAAQTFWPRLTSTMFFSATNYALPLYPFFVLAALLVSPLRALYRILNKNPRNALAELVAPLWLASKTPAYVRERNRIRSTQRVPRNVVNQLYATPREHFSQQRDKRLARNALRKKLYGPTEFDKREIRAQARTRRIALLIIVVALASVSFYAFRGMWHTLYEDARIVGGALLPAAGGWAELWQQWTSGWIRDGLGASAPADPLLTTLAPLMVLTLGNLQLSVNLVTLFSLIASGLGAWFAAGAVTRSVIIRMWAALFWVAAPALLVAVAHGRMGAVITHAVLPWLILALLRALGIHKRDERGNLRFRHEQRQEEELAEKGIHTSQANAYTPPQGSLAALGTAALLFAVIAAGTPVLLVPGIIIFSVAAIMTRTRSLLAVPIPALALLGPLLFRGWINRDYDGWRVLFADPGAPYAHDPSPAWQRLLGMPEPLADMSQQTLFEHVITLLPLCLGAVILIGATLSLVRKLPAALPIRMLWLMAVLGLATSLISSSITVASGDHGAVLGWSGAGLSLMMVGFLGSCVVAADGIAIKTIGFSFGWRQIALGIATLLVFAIPAATLTIWGNNHSLTDTPTPLRALDRMIVPAVAQQMQQSGRQARVLLIEPIEPGTISYQLLHDDGLQLTETATVVDVAYLQGRPDDFAELVAHLARGLEQKGEPAASFRLSEIAVGAVLVPPGNTDETAQLIARIDTIAGLQRITENETGTVWRVDPQELDPQLATPQPDAHNTTPIDAIVQAGEPAWATLYSRNDEGTLTDPIPLDAQRLAVHGTLPAGTGTRTVLLAENTAPGWKATLHGKPLTSTQINGRQAFDIPPTQAATRIDITYERSSQMPWMILQSVVLIVFGLLAIPVRRKGTHK